MHRNIQAAADTRAEMNAVAVEPTVVYGSSKHAVEAFSNFRNNSMVRISDIGEFGFH